MEYYKGNGRSSLIAVHKTQETYPSKSDFVQKNIPLLLHLLSGSTKFPAWVCSCRQQRRLIMLRAHIIPGVYGFAFPNGKTASEIYEESMLNIFLDH